jgi:hypothetical protein
MTQSQEAKTTLPATVRAELLVNTAGERLGTLAGTLVERFRQVRHAQQEQADKTSLPEGQSRSEETWKVQSVEAGQPAMMRGETHPPAMVRAEEMVGLAGERMAHWTKDSNLQIRRAMAFLREGTEDMWVEAQNLRHQWEHMPR